MHTGHSVGLPLRLPLIALMVLAASSLPACAGAPSPDRAANPDAGAEKSAPDAGDGTAGGAPVTGSGKSAPAPGDAANLLPLLRPGRALRYRARSRMDTSRPDDRPQPAVGHVFSTLTLEGTADDGSPLLRRESFPYFDDAATSAGLSTPRERRRERLRLDTGRFVVEGLETTTEARLGRDRWGPPATLAFTTDGFGLNMAARRAVGMWSLTVPRELFGRLMERDEVTLDVDLYLVVDDPRADRVVRSAVAGATAPPKAESRVRGRTVFRVQGRELFPLDHRLADTDETGRSVLTATPDRRVALPVVRIVVVTDLVIESLGRAPAVRTSRRDRLTCSVLDRPGEPWILSWEGLVRTESGDPDDPVLREASVSRGLVRLDDPAPAP